MREQWLKVLRILPPTQGGLALTAKEVASRTVTATMLGAEATKNAHKS